MSTLDVLSGNSHFCNFTTDGLSLSTLDVLSTILTFATSRHTTPISSHLSTKGEFVHSRSRNYTYGKSTALARASIYQSQTPSTPQRLSLRLLKLRESMSSTPRTGIMERRRKASFADNVVDEDGFQEQKCRVAVSKLYQECSAPQASARLTSQPGSTHQDGLGDFCAH